MKEEVEEVGWEAPDKKKDEGVALVASIGTLGGSSRGLDWV